MSRNPIDGSRRSSRASSWTVQGTRCSIAREAVFTIIEHEEMHQETLQYIWHRLPLDQKHRPPGVAPATRRPGTRACTRGDPRRYGHARRTARARCRSDGTTSSAKLSSTSRPSRWIGTMSRTRSSGRSWKTGATGASRCGRRLPGQWRTARAGDAPALLGAARRAVALARHVRSPAAAARVARVRESCRGGGVCALARRPADDRGGVSPCGVRNTRRAGAGAAMG